MTQICIDQKNYNQNLFLPEIKKIMKKFLTSNIQGKIFNKKNFSSKENFENKSFYKINFRLQNLRQKTFFPLKEV